MAALKEPIEKRAGERPVDERLVARDDCRTVFVPLTDELKEPGPPSSKTKRYGLTEVNLTGGVGITITVLLLDDDAGNVIGDRQDYLV